MRSGVIAQKVGMTRVYNDAGEHVPVTVLRLDNVQVVAQRTVEKNGYVALQLGAGQSKVKNTTKGLRGHFAAASVEPKAKLVEFRVSEDNLIDVGAKLTASHFEAGQLVDVTGTTIGKGFAGAMKRHNFGGLRATTACPFRTVRTVRPVTTRIRVRSGRASAWLVTWARRASPPRTLKWYPPTKSVA